MLKYDFNVTIPFNGKWVNSPNLIKKCQNFSQSIIGPISFCRIRPPTESQSSGR